MGDHQGSIGTFGVVHLTGLQVEQSVDSGNESFEADLGFVFAIGSAEAVVGIGDCFVGAPGNGVG